MKACIVTGDRYAERDIWIRAVELALNRTCHDDSLLVIHGAATGIDAMAGDLAFDRQHLTELPMPAQWKQHGKAAGPRRNAAMLHILAILAEHGYEISVLAFHDELAGSKGTKNMVNLAVAAGVETWHWTTYNDPVRVTEVIR